MTRRLVLPLAALALAVAGCGSDDDDGGGSTNDGSAGKPGEVAMTDSLKFEPAEITVKVGDKVTWRNTGSIPHNAIADDGQFRSPIFGEGKTYSFTARKAGEIRYVCTLHPGMDGTITVE